MQKGFKKNKLSRKQKLRQLYLSAVLSHQRLVSLFRNPSTEGSQALRFFAIFNMGLLMLFIGGFNIHNNLVMFTPLGITLMILSIFLLNRDMEEKDIANNAETELLYETGKPFLLKHEAKNKTSQ